MEKSRKGVYPMKNKLQQMILTTVLFVISVFFFYWLFDSFVLLTIFIELLTILVASYLIFFDQRNATSKFAWLFAMLMLPYVGLLLFLLLGRNQQKRRFSATQKKNHQQLERHLAQLFSNQEHWIAKEQTLSKELYHLSGNAALRGNVLTSLSDGEQAFQQLLNDVRQAKHHIHLFYFIYKADETGNELAELLKEKVAQGIEVRLMYDGVGSFHLPFEWLDQLRAAGIEVRPYDLVNSPLLSTRLNWRNHRKMVVIDGEIAHIGGMNLGNEYRSITDKFSYWRDTNLRIKGPAALEVQGVFLNDWIYFEQEENAAAFFTDQTTVYFPTTFTEQEEDENCQILFGGPYDKERIIHDAFMDVIGKATKSIKIASPYFVPDEESLSTLRRAARSGIRVQIIIPGKGDRALSYFGNTSFIDSLLTAGIDVYFYDKEAFLHAKYMIIDDQLATIGSTNFDMRSFYLNHEISAFIYGPSKTVATIVDQFNEDLSKSERVTQKQRAKRSISQRVKEKLSAFFSPLL